MEGTGPKPRKIQLGQTENRSEVPRPRGGVLHDLPESVPVSPGRILSPQVRLETRGQLSVEGDPCPRNQLEGVPLGGIVRRRDRDPTGRPVMLRSHEQRRRRNDPEIDNPGAHRLEPGDHSAQKHGARGAGVAPNTHGVSETLPLEEGAEGSC